MGAFVIFSHTTFPESIICEASKPGVIWKNERIRRDAHRHRERAPL